MIITLLTLFVILTIVLCILGTKSTYYDDGLYGGAFFSGSIAVVLLIAAAFIAIDVVSGRKLDDKIALYQEANTVIEQKISNSIADYMGYEAGMFKDLDINAIVMKYPELKANELVQEEIKVYQDNNKKILELKEAKIDLDVKRWWLYFGGEE